MGLINIYKYSHTMKPLLSNRFAVSFYPGDTTVLELQPMMKFNVVSVTMPNWSIECSDTRMRYGSTQFALPVFNFSSSTLTIEFSETEGMEVTTFLTNLFSGPVGSKSYWRISSPQIFKIKIDEFDYTYQKILNSHIYAVKIKSLGQPEFSNTAKGEPITISAEFNIVYQLNTLNEDLTGNRKNIDIPVIQDSKLIQARVEQENKDKIKFITEQELIEIYQKELQDRKPKTQAEKDAALLALAKEINSVLGDFLDDNDGRIFNELKSIGDLDTLMEVFTNTQTGVVKQIALKQALEKRDDLSYEDVNAILERLHEFRREYDNIKSDKIPTVIPGLDDAYDNWKASYLEENNYIESKELPSAPIDPAEAGTSVPGLPPGQAIPNTVGVDAATPEKAWEAIQKIKNISRSKSLNGIKSADDVEKQLKENWKKIVSDGNTGGATYEQYKAVTLANLINTVESVETINKNLEGTGLTVKISGLFDAGHDSNNAGNASHLWGAKADLEIYDTNTGKRLKFGDVGTATPNQSGYGAQQMTQEQVATMSAASKNTNLTFSREIREGSAGWDDAAIGQRYVIENGKIVVKKSTDWTRSDNTGRVIAEETKVKGKKTSFTLLEANDKGFTHITRDALNGGKSKAKIPLR